MNSQEWKDFQRAAERRNQEQAQREKEKQTLLKRLRECLEQDLLTAENFYQTKCTNRISPEEYAAEKKKHKQSLLKKLREHLEQNHLEVDNFYQARCTGYISTEDYETEKKNAERREKERQLHRERREKARREKERQPLLKKLKEYLEQDCLAADNFYQARCTDYISTEDYENEKRRARERRTLLKKLRKYLKQDLREADSFYQTRCTDYISPEEYAVEKKKHKQSLLKKLREYLEQNYLEVDNFYQTRCTDYISTKEYETEKINYVQSWAEDLGLEYLPDREQAAAIGAVEGNVQVVARAGSGKTSTLVNRALFLQRHCDVAPDEMLLLAFNRKAAKEMQKRLASYLPDSVPHIMTFHALAYRLVRPDEEILFDEEKGEQRQSRAIQDIVDCHIRNPNYRNQIRALMLVHFRADWKRIISDGYDRKPEDMLRYRRSLVQESLDGTYVKSLGEKVISNFLFEHDIEYKYKRSFGESGINCCPDFRIGNRSGVIIEYFGLRGDPDYDAELEEKRNCWRNNPNWELLEFSPNDLESNGVEGFCALLKQELEGYGILCNRLSEEEIWDKIKDRAIDGFTRATVGFINRCRKLSLTVEQLSEKVNNHDFIGNVEEHFSDLAQIFYASYLESFQRTGKDDFDGLVQKAAEHVAAGKTEFGGRFGYVDLKRIRFVMIDEYQDFSELFYRLMHVIRGQNPRARFFCVGDDWQAINGFAGSDLYFFENFSQIFQDSCELSVATNYRSAKAIVDVGNALMEDRGIPARAHTDEAGKVMIANLDAFQPTPQEQHEHREDSRTPAVLRLVDRAINDDKNVVLLSRMKSLPWYVNYNGRGSQSTESALDRFLELVRSRLPDELAEKVTISTVHKYKGLEDDVVIVLDAVRYPLIHPHWIFTRIFGDSIESIVDEERRLFYVALTRAKEDLFVLTETDDFPPFLEDIEKNIELDRLKWSDYPPLAAPTQYITIRVGNQNGRGPGPTVAIKDLLKSKGYDWDDSSKTWWRVRLAERFTVPEFINRSSWSDLADGITVGFYDYLDNEIALYHVDDGQWKCIRDNIQESNG